MRRNLSGRDILDTRNRGTLRRRLDGGAASSSRGSVTVPNHVQPLNESMGQDWARGEVTSKQVLESAFLANH